MMLRESEIKIGRRRDGVERRRGKKTKIGKSKRNL